MQHPRPFSSRLLPAPADGGFRMDGYWVWCGSAVRGEDGRYHLFAARWPHAYPFFQGYLAASEVVRAVADSPTGPFSFAEVVLPDRGPSFWDGRMTHNPTVLRWRDTYCLFYIGAVYDGPRPRPTDLSWERKGLPWYSSIRIGMATAPSVYGPWTRPDVPTLDISPDGSDGAVVTNPAPCLAPDGRLLLYYRLNTPHGCRIRLAVADEPGAPFAWRSPGPVLDVAGKPVEDPFVWWNGDCYEMIAKDLAATDDGSITGRRHSGIHAFSPDGLSWTLADPPMAYSRDLLLDDGRTLHLGSFERPQLLIEDGVPRCLYAAAGDGADGFWDARHTWNVAVPLR